MVKNSSRLLGLRPILGPSWPGFAPKCIIVMTTSISKACTEEVVYVLNIPKPAENENETVQETRNRQKLDNDDEICRGHILNGMSDALFDVYQNETTAKALWEKLEAKYMQEDATSKKFLASNNYMVDGCSVMDQLHEIEKLSNNYKQHNMHMDETIIVVRSFISFLLHAKILKEH
ncbi:hypothetical protein GH714_034963 [Hevea brasiliensis]|uniref:Zinc finger, CCHC-type n=1 Tax=Hevea brasiliensis TaxID=3981 RepID=A0A6A6LPJ3_HEVBR|nr:hypothetical protein GH714_034963 [Hevea brasiliensis]